MKSTVFLQSRLYSLCAFIVTPALLFFIISSVTQAQVVLDSEPDGLLDAWELEHFGSLTDPDGDPGDDPDGDGDDNMAECNAGTDPNDVNSCFLVVESTFDPANLKVAWSSIRGKKYHIEVSDDAQNWSKLGNAAGTVPFDFFGTDGDICADFSNPAAPMIIGGCDRDVWFLNPGPGGTGNINTFKTTVSALSPSGSEWRDSLKGPTDYGDEYGALYRGFIVPKTTGSYTFYIASRHASELRLNTGLDPADDITPVDSALATPALNERISYLNDGQLIVEEDWDYLASVGETDTQKSSPVALTAGQKYYFEVWHTHFGQWDHLAVGWERDASGTIDIVPGDCLAPYTDGVDLTDNNAALLLTGPMKFVRVVTYGPLSAGAVDSDGDLVDDSTENALAGYHPFRSQSANRTQDDGITLTAGGTADPANDVISISSTSDYGNGGLGREFTGINATTGVPNAPDVLRYTLHRSGSLEPQTILFSLSGPLDTLNQGVPTPSDYVVSEPFGPPMIPAGGTFAVSFGFGETECDVEIVPVADLIVEVPEVFTVDVAPSPGNYTVGAASTSVGTFWDANDNADNDRYYFAQFSKEQTSGPTSGNGATLIKVNGSNRVGELTDFFQNLTTPMFDRHIHKANLNGDGITLNKGGIIHEIIDDAGDPLLGVIPDPAATGTFPNNPLNIPYTWNITSASGGSFSAQELIDSLEFNNPNQGAPAGTTPLYQNIHTNDNPGGEVWCFFSRALASTDPPSSRVDPTPNIEPIDPVTEPDKLRAEVVRFLTQATFGPTEKSIAELTDSIVNTHGGDRIAAFNAWIDAQYALPQTLLEDYVLAADMQEWWLRGYFDPARYPNPGASPTIPIEPATPAAWPSFATQDISNHDSLVPSTWRKPDADYPISGAQDNKGDNTLGEPNYLNRHRGMWTLYCYAQDQLRQRVAFTLSEILVVSSELTDVRNHHLGASRWWDMLGENADDNFREALEDVTYSPIMGKYLSSIGNGSFASTGVPPDENYAREIMQLFSIGLVDLWDDGYIKLDAATKNVVQTYTNDEITGLAEVMTGLGYITSSASDTNFDNPNIDTTPPNSWFDDTGGNKYYSSRYLYPMAMYNFYHDNGSKTIAGGKVISNPAGANGRYPSEGHKDLGDIHNYFGGTQNNVVGPKSFAATWSTNANTNHQNTPAFISRRMIQRMVTSNPDPDYLYRVAQVWRSTNGNIKEVVRAILTDPAARNISDAQSDIGYGKKKEPLLAFIQAIRALNARSHITLDGSVIAGDPRILQNVTYTGGIAPITQVDLGYFGYPSTEEAKFLGTVQYDTLGQPVTSGGIVQTVTPTRVTFSLTDSSTTTQLRQSPLKAPTVFNWFLPDYQPGGLVASFGLLAPEFQIADENSVIQNVNMYYSFSFGSTGFGTTALAGGVPGQNSHYNQYTIAGYSTRTGTANYYDEHCFLDHAAWINKLNNYPTPDPALDDFLEKQLALVDELDDLLTAGLFKKLYPFDPSDDGAQVSEGALPHFPNRNPREILVHTLKDSYPGLGNPGGGTQNDRDTVRLALYLFLSTPEFLTQK